MAMDADLHEHAERLDRTLRVAWRARPSMLTTARAAGLNERQLDTGEVDALDHIATQGGEPMSALARRLRIDPSTATRTVDRLASKGLVSRRRDPTDARRQLVALTPAGEAAQAESAARRTALARRLIKRLDVADQDEIGRLWPSLAEAIDGVLAGTAPTNAKAIVTSDDPAASDDRESVNADALGRAWQLMRRARAGILGRATGTLDGLRLEAGDVDTLDQIVAAGGSTQMSALASGLDVTASSATKAVDRVVRKGLAVRSGDPNDRRFTHVSLTDVGTRVQAHVQAERVAFSAEVLRCFVVDDRETIARLLPRIADAVIEEFGALRTPS